VKREGVSIMAEALVYVPKLFAVFVLEIYGNALYRIATAVKTAEDVSASDGNG
jgi:hypothetical protein